MRFNFRRRDDSTSRVGRRGPVEEVERIDRVLLAQYNAYDARSLFAHLLDRVRDGEQIVIARAGTPIAKLVPLDGDERCRPGLLRTSVIVHRVPRRSR